MSSRVAHYAALSRRSIVTTARQPAAIVPSMLFPLLFTAMSAASLNESINLPGFPPVQSFLQFLIATTVVQGALFGSIQAGAGLATDIEQGFFERLLASPVSRNSIIVGRLAGAAALGFVQAWLFFAVTVLVGLTVRGGLPAVALISIVAAVLAAGIGGISVAFALKTGSNEAVQGAFPMLFAGLFLSSAFFPRNLMHGWFKNVADINPLSHMIEGLRVQVVFGVDLAELGIALAVAGGIFTVGLVSSRLALHGRLKART